MVRICWVLTLVIAIIGFVVLLHAMSADTAPQQAAGVVFAIGLAVIPYVATRAIQEFSRE